MLHVNPIFLWGYLEKSCPIAILPYCNDLVSLYCHAPSFIPPPLCIDMHLSRHNGCSTYSSAHALIFRTLSVMSVFILSTYKQVCDFGLSRLKHNTFLSSKSTAGTVRRRPTPKDTLQFPDYVRHFQFHCEFLLILLYYVLAGVDGTRGSAE